MNRRGFLGLTTAAAASIFVPQFGRFFREGSGSLWAPPKGIQSYSAAELNELLKRYFFEYYQLQVNKPSAFEALFDLQRRPTGRTFQWGMGT